MSVKVNYNKFNECYCELDSIVSLLNNAKDNLNTLIDLASAEEFDIQNTCIYVYWIHFISFFCVSLCF